MCIHYNNHDPLSPFAKELPEDLWFEIFVRSSADSLLRVEAVCKPWYAIVKDPSFIKCHLEYQKMISKDRGLFLFRQHHTDNDNSNYFLFDEQSLACGTTSSFPLITNLLDPRLHVSSMACIHGSINGLYCVYSGNDRFVIWNPATSELGFLPLPQDFLGPELCIYCGVIGFGRDPLNEENYKIVLFCEYGRINMGFDSFCSLLYSSTTNTWRRVDDPVGLTSGDPTCFSSKNTYLNGVYYWMWKTFHGSGKMVVAFDMGEKETFQSIPIPRVYLQDEENYNGDIALHGDHIALFMVDKKRYDLDIWVLEDDHSWIQKFYVKGIQGVVSSLGFLGKDDELLLVIDNDDPSTYHENSQTVVYNTTSRNVTRKVGPRGMYSEFGTVVSYESLVSVSGGMTKYKGNHASALDVVAEFLYEDVE